MKTVVKSSGKIVVFSNNKLQQSLRTTFRMLKTPEGQAEQFMEKTMIEFIDWQKDKPEITSSDIRRIISKILETIHPDAAYIFKNFKSIM